jgi:glycosyltransferase involved in cell wall biosynthesis
MNFKITLLPGDGIGPEVVGEAVRVLEVIASKYNHTFNFQERLMGGCSIDKYGSSLTDEALADCQASDAVLLGAVGGPKWDDPNAKDRPERGLLALRKGLGVFANLRPARAWPGLEEAGPLKPSVGIVTRSRGVALHDVTDRVVRKLLSGDAAAFPDRNIKVLEQRGEGKADAVFMGFDAARGDVLMILDADLTVPPEQLPKFWQAIASGKGEFINGSRLVYPREEEAMKFLNTIRPLYWTNYYLAILSFANSTPRGTAETCPNRFKVCGGRKSMPSCSLCDFQSRVRTLNLFVKAPQMKRCFMLPLITGCGFPNRSRCTAQMLTARERCCRWRGKGVCAGWCTPPAWRRWVLAMLGQWWMRRRLCRLRG